MLFSLFSQSRKVFRAIWAQRAARLNNKAERLRERGKFDEAVALLDRAIRLDSRMAEAYVNRCRCYCDLHEYAKAIEDASQAIALEPEMVSAFRARAYAAYELDQNESAIADLTKALKLGSEDPWIYHERSCAFSHEGDYRAAIADVDRFLEQRPEEARGYYGRACYRYRLDDLNSSFADIDEAVRLEPKNGKFLFIRARLLWELGRLDEALAEYEAALGQNCEAKDDWRNHAIVEEKWLGGAMADKQGNYREAIEQFDAALEIIERSLEFQESMDRYARLYYERGKVWYHLEEYEKALRDLDEAVAFEPENGVILWMLAKVLFLVDRIEEASAAYEAALAHEREGEKVCWESERNWLGGAIALKQGNCWEAIALFEAALEADPTVSRVHSDCGEAWYQLWEYEHALRDFDKAITLEPDHAVYYINRANALMGLQRYAEANRDLIEARRRGPDCAHSYRYLAWFKATCPEPEFRNGKQAIAMAHKAIELAGGQPTWDHCRTLAAAYAENGDFDEAIRWQTEALATVPEERRCWCEAILEKYRVRIPHRMPQREDFNW